MGAHGRIFQVSNKFTIYSPRKQDYRKWFIPNKYLEKSLNKESNLTSNSLESSKIPITGCHLPEAGHPTVMSALIPGRWLYNPDQEHPQGKMSTTTNGSVRCMQCLSGT